jgi:hypothetical protein
MKDAILAVLDAPCPRCGSPVAVDERTWTASLAHRVVILCRLSAHTVGAWSVPVDGRPVPPMPARWTPRLCEDCHTVIEGHPQRRFCTPCARRRTSAAARRWQARHGRRKAVAV